jgi:tRNA pseudouridine55 synthase
VHGWVVLDKPLGMSSARAVGAVRRAFDAAKAGHGGTLDPLASGVLPIALGEATKTVAWAMTGRKIYDFTIGWGEARATDDAEGEITATAPGRPDRAAIEAVLPRFTGRIWQTPPGYSALKVQGQRAYALARAGEEPVLEPRLAEIFDLQLVGMPDPDHASFRATVGKGVYIRALARDLALALGTLGHVAALRRLAVGAFTLEAAISLDKLAALGHSAAASKHLLPIETALDDIPALALSEAEAHRLSQGQPVTPVDPDAEMRLARLGPGALVRAVSGKRLVALAEIGDGGLRPRRVINLDTGESDVDHG